MQNNDKLCLQWNDFKENVNSAFGKLREDNDFSDVTLACEDGKQLQAHKIVLASSSPFFMELLQKNKHPHPLIYMRGIKYEDLVAIIDFLYIGEANVYQENLDSFLAVAGELRLKGLSGETKEEARIENKEQFTTKPVRKPFNQTFSSPEEDQPQFDHKNTVAVVSTAISVELENLDEQINSMIDLTDRVDPHTKRKLVICNVCGNEGQRAFVARHIEAKHITGVSQACDICGKTARSRNSLRVHKFNNHK